MRMQLAHVGINIQNEDELKNVFSFFGDTLGLEIHEEKTCIFMDSYIEIMKKKGPREKGHIAFSVENMEEAICFLKEKGIAFADENFKYDEEGRISAAYFREEAAGFAVHLIPMR